MTPQSIGGVSIVLLLVLILLRIPIGIALVIAGFIGNAVFLGFHSAIVQFQLVTWEVATNFVLITLPLFVWMGQLAESTDMGKDLYSSFHKWFGRAPGGLAITSIASSAGFGAITGSSVATVSAMGNMLMPEMKRYRYDSGLATGSLASAGVLAILIPPSVPLVFYGAWTETSLGDLFIAGIVPGIMLALLFILYVCLHCSIKPSLAPKGEHFTWSAKLHSLIHLLPILSVMLMVLLSLYFGIATPTEAAAVGVAGVFVVGLIRRRINLKVVLGSISQSAALSTNIFVLFLGGMFFSRFMAQTDLTQSMISSISALTLPPYLIMMMIVLMYLFLGAILDTFGMIILTLPFVFPLVLSLGFDPVWFGIFVVMMIELSLITPPIGINVFVMQSVVPDIPLSTIYQGSIPFVLLTLLMVALLIAFPEIALWLPAQMKSN